MGVTGTIQSAADTIGQPLAGVTLVALGIRAGALGLAGVSVVTGMICFGTATLMSGRRRQLSASSGSPES